jgi:hypothetical protein
VILGNSKKFWGGCHFWATVRDRGVCGHRDGRIHGLGPYRQAAILLCVSPWSIQLFPVGPDGNGVGAVRGGRLAQGSNQRPGESETVRDGTTFLSAP